MQRCRLPDAFAPEGQKLTLVLVTLETLEGTACLLDISTRHIVLFNIPIASNRVYWRIRCKVDTMLHEWRREGRKGYLSDLGDFSDDSMSEQPKRGMSVPVLQHTQQLHPPFVHSITSRAVH